jgi:hypothetical protein
MGGRDCDGAAGFGGSAAGLALLISDLMMIEKRGFGEVR